MEDAVSTLGFKSEFLVVTSRYTGHAPTEVKNIILSYPSIKQIMMDLHYEIPWAENSGANLGRQPTENYASGLDDAQKQGIISQKRLRSKILGLWIKNSLTT